MEAQAKPIPEKLDDVTPVNLSYNPSNYQNVTVQESVGKMPNLSINLGWITFLLNHKYKLGAFVVACLVWFILELGFAFDSKLYMMGGSKDFKAQFLVGSKDKQAEIMSDFNGPFVSQYYQKTTVVPVPKVEIREKIESIWVENGETGTFRKLKN